jgi:very-short-patch-repair endonuclease
MAAVLASGDGAVLSHRSAAVLWGFARHRSGPIDVTSAHGRSGRPGIRLHECKLDVEEATTRRAIPITTPARTLFDLAEAVDWPRLRSACEEADRLGFLQMKKLERVVERGWGRHALKPIRQILVKAPHPEETRSPLEERFLEFCRNRNIPAPVTNVTVLGFEVDALWPQARLIAELDSWAFHHHRGAFERDRVRDAAHLVAGYRTIRITDRRLRREGRATAAQIHGLLGRT